MILGWAVTSKAATIRHYKADHCYGDSIAVGTCAYLHIPTTAHKNLGSCAIADFVSTRPFDHVVISAGINDQGLCVLPLRSKVHAQRVIWIIPAPINSGRAMVLQSMRIGDRFVTYACAGGCTKRNFHPASYAVVAAAVRRQW